MWFLISLLVYSCNHFTVYVTLQIKWIIACMIYLFLSFIYLSYFIYSFIYLSFSIIEFAWRCRFTTASGAWQDHCWGCCLGRRVLCPPGGLMLTRWSRRCRVKSKQTEDLYKSKAFFVSLSKLVFHIRTDYLFSFLYYYILNFALTEQRKTLH